MLLHFVIRTFIQGQSAGLHPVCLMRIAHGGIGPFTDVRFRTVWFIKLSINRTGCMTVREINAF